MTLKAQQIAIEKACGWKGPFGMSGPHAGKCGMLATGLERRHGTPPDDKGQEDGEPNYEPVPDYVNDLNRSTMQAAG